MFTTYVEFHAALLRDVMQTNAQGESLVNSDDYTINSSVFYTDDQVGLVHGERFSSLIPINKNCIKNYFTYCSTLLLERLEAVIPNKFQSTPEVVPETIKKIVRLTSE